VREGPPRRLLAVGLWFLERLEPTGSLFTHPMKLVRPGGALVPLTTDESGPEALRNVVITSPLLFRQSLPPSGC